MCHYARPVSVNDEHNDYIQIFTPPRATSEVNLNIALNVWLNNVLEFEKRYAPIEDRSKKVGLMALIPKETYDNRLLGTTEDLTYADLLTKTKAISRDRALVSTQEKAPSRKAQQNDPMEIDAVDAGGAEESRKRELDKLIEQMESLNALVRKFVPKGKGSGKGDRRPGPKGGKGQYGAPAAPGAYGKPKGAGKGKKPRICYRCGGTGHPARICPSDQSANELGEEEGEEEPSQEEEECPRLMSLQEDEENVAESPKKESPDLTKHWGPMDDWAGHDYEMDVDISAAAPAPTPAVLSASAEKGPWAPLAHVSLSALWDAAEDEQGDREDLFRLEEEEMPSRRAGRVKITAVVDSGAMVSAMPDHLVPFIKAQETAESEGKKCYRGPGGEAIPVQGQQAIKVHTAEGFETKTTWKVRHVKRPLLSVPQITNREHSVHLDRKNPRIKHAGTGRITKLRYKGKVFELDIWIKVPKGYDASRLDASGFQRPGMRCGEDVARRTLTL